MRWRVAMEVMMEGDGGAGTAVLEQRNSAREETQKRNGDGNIHGEEDQNDSTSCVLISKHNELLFATVSF